MGIWIENPVLQQFHGVVANIGGRLDDGCNAGAEKIWEWKFVERYQR